MTIDALTDCITYAYIDEPPFGYLGPAGEGEGYDIDIARYVASEMGFDTFKAQMVSFGELAEGVSANRWMINTAMFTTAERSKVVSFSRPIWRLNDGFAMRREDGLDIENYEDLALRKNLRVGAVRGNVQVQLALEAGLNPEKLTLFKTQAEVFDQIMNNNIDIYPGAALAHRRFISRAGLTGLENRSVARDVLPGGQAFGAFSFNKEAVGFASAFDDKLHAFLGSKEHRAIAGRHGLDDWEALLAPA